MRMANASRPWEAEEQHVRIAGALLWAALWLAWQLIRIPVFLFLAILEPVVRFVLGSLALLLMLTAFFYKAYGVPHFPFWLTIAISLGLAFLLAVYDLLLRLFSR